MEKAAKTNTLYRAAACLLALLCLGTMAKTMLVGLEIDEQYALSLSYRLLRGDTLFGTMWEPHQLSALPVAVLLALFMAVTGGTTGILLFVRAVMLAAKALLSTVFYKNMRGTVGQNGALLSALVLFLYTPKWFLAPDYVSQQFHFTVAAFLCFWGYYAPGPRRFTRWWLVAAGCVPLCLSFLAYPQSIAAAAVYGIGFWLLGARYGEKRLGPLPRGVLVLAVGCAACGAAFVGYVLAGVSPALLAEHAALILNDPQYNFTAGERLALLGGQAAAVLGVLAGPLLAALACGAAAWLRRRSVPHAADVFFALWPSFTLLCCLYATLRDATLDARSYLLVLTLAGAWFFRGGRGAYSAREVLFWLGYLPGLAAYAFILRSTLIALPTTFMYLMWPALCVLLAMLNRAPAGTAGKGAQLVLALLLVLLVTARLWLVLVTGWKPTTVETAALRYIPEGPAAGTWADETMADRQQALCRALAPYRGCRLLQAIGEVNGLGYLCADGTLQVGQASVISGTDSDPRFSAYYAEYPEKTPDVVLYDFFEVRDLDAFHAWIESTLPITARHEVIEGGAGLNVLEIAP